MPPRDEFVLEDVSKIILQKFQVEHTVRKHYSETKRGRLEEVLEDLVWQFVTVPAHLIELPDDLLIEMVDHAADARSQLHHRLPEVSSVVESPYIGQSHESIFSWISITKFM